MTEATEVPGRLPAGVLAAVLLPSALVGAFQVSRELGGPAAPVEGPALAVLWAFTTFPLALMAWGLRAPRGRSAGGPPPEVEAALSAVARAEALVARSAQAQERLEALLAQRGPTGQAAADAVPRAAARRSALLAASLAALFVLSAAGLAEVFTGPAAAPRFEHIHPNFAVFADGARIDYQHAAFDLAQRGIVRAHQHVGDGLPGALHIEGPPGHTLAGAFRDALGTNLTEHGLQLDDDVHDGARYEENATHRLRLMVQAEGASDWVEVKPVASYVPRNHDRLLVSFGDERGAALAAQQDAVPTRFP